MKVKDVMTKNPVCCRSTDSAMEVAGVLRDKDIGSVPVISSESQQLEGIITDRDLCLGVLAGGLDARQPLLRVSSRETRLPATLKMTLKVARRPCKSTKFAALP